MTETAKMENCECARRHRTPRMPHGTRSPWSMNATATNLQQQRQHVAHSMRCPLQPGAVLINLNVASKQRQQNRRIGNRSWPCTERNPHWLITGSSVATSCIIHASTLQHLLLQIPAFLGLRSGTDHYTNNI